MAENAVNVGGHSPEQVAFQLLGIVAHGEGKHLFGAHTPRAERDWILDTYAECLIAVKNPESRRKAGAPPT